MVKYFSNINWRIKTLPPRYFNWRVRGNSLWWSFDLGVEEIGKLDFIVATSMVDLATLRGLRPELSIVPTILYFHENQFAYPMSEHIKGKVEVQITSIYSALSADKCLFNSRYNLESFLNGAQTFLKKMPDFVPVNASEIVDTIRAKSVVLPVPLSEENFEARNTQRDHDQCFHIVWNHRWEWDKDPELLLNLIIALPSTLPLVFHVIGQSFRSSPSVFTEIKKTLSQRGWLGEWGFIERREDYIRVLQKSQLVLSTAEHDFQGLSVLEAVKANCLPLLPKRVVYPEYFPDKFLYEVEDISGFKEKICSLVRSCMGDGKLYDDFLVLAKQQVQAFSWSAQGEAYSAEIEAVCSLKARAKVDSTQELK